MGKFNLDPRYHLAQMYVTQNSGLSPGQLDDNRCLAGVDGNISGILGKKAS